MKLVIVFLPVLLVTASFGAAAKRPNILLVISDDQTWLHTSAARDPVVRTPNFDRVAAEGVRFTHGFCAASSCSPSRAALLTGQHIWRLGAAAWISGPLHPSIPTYVDLLEGAGYVVGMTGKGWAPGPSEGWGRTRNPAGPAFQKHGRNYPRNFQEFLTTVPDDKPFCFWFGSTNSHRPFTRGSGKKAGLDHERLRLPAQFPDTPEARADMADYLAEIQDFDRELGEILAALSARGQIDNTLVVLTSDNGMDFPRSKATLYDYGMRMPFAIRWPALVPGGRVVSDPVNHVDLAPTFLEAAGLKVPPAMSGRSLIKVLVSHRSTLVDPDRTMTFYGLERHAPYRPDAAGYPCRAVRTGQFLYIRNYFPDRWPNGDPPHFADPSSDTSPAKEWILANRSTPVGSRLFALCYGKRPAEELYDSQADPDQFENLAGRPEHAEIVRQLRKALVEFQERTGDPRAKSGPTEWDELPGQLGPPFKFPEFLPADNADRINRLKERFFSKGQK